jgi:hypothetical protein
MNLEEAVLELEKPGKLRWNHSDAGNVSESLPMQYFMYVKSRLTMNRR